MWSSFTPNKWIQNTFVFNFFKTFQFHLEHNSMHHQFAVDLEYGIGSKISFDWLKNTQLLHELGDLSIYWAKTNKTVCFQKWLKHKSAWTKRTRKNAFVFEPMKNVSMLFTFRSNLYLYWINKSKRNSFELFSFCSIENVWILFYMLYVCIYISHTIDLKLIICWWWIEIHSNLFI